MECLQCRKKISNLNSWKAHMKHHGYTDDEIEHLLVIYKDNGNCW